MSDETLQDLLSGLDEDQAALVAQEFRNAVQRVRSGAAGDPNQGLAGDVNAQARNIQRLAGVDLTDADPEIEHVRSASYGSPEDYLGAVSQAVKAKKARVNRDAEVTKRQRRIAELRKLPSYHAEAQKEINRLSKEITDLMRGSK